MSNGWKANKHSLNIKKIKYTSLHKNFYKDDLILKLLGLKNENKNTENFSWQHKAQNCLENIIFFKRVSIILSSFSN